MPVTRTNTRDTPSGYVTSIGPGVSCNPPGKRFCETCQLPKPKGKRKAIKGWKCDDCRRARVKP